MATRKFRRSTVSVSQGPSLRSKNEVSAKIVSVADNLGPTKRTRSKMEIVQEPQQKRRAVFGDITNKNTRSLKDSKLPVKKQCETKVKKTNFMKPKCNPKQEPLVKDSQCNLKLEEPLIEEITKALQPIDLTKDDKLESSVEITRVSSPIKPELPKIDFDEFDNKHMQDPFWEAIYARDIFDYYKQQESKFVVPDYMLSKQKDITGEMRGILVDWLVEIQTNFELCHETLYLAVKLVDMYLAKVPIKRTRLQLVGTAAMFIACKYDERILPQCDDFLYMSDNAYSIESLFDMEKKIFVAVDFLLGFPLSYRFLRRYCKVANFETKTLTLARYILELSLLEYRFAYEMESLKAAGCLWLALKMEGLQWNAMLSHHSGYCEAEAKEMGKKLNYMLLNPSFNPVNEVYGKYSNQVFMKVADIPKLSMEQLDTI
ncbi:G2/mitotic-specific cyclin-B3-like [Argonauta hians]